MLITLHKDFYVIDADAHVMEPGDLWDRYIDKEFYGVRPVIHSEYHGALEVIGKAMPRSYEDTDYRDRTSLIWAEQRVIRRGFDPESYVEAMDQMGIDQMVLYPSMGLYAASVHDMDGRLASAISRAYNRWLHDLREVAPDRLFGVGLLALQDPRAAVDDAIYAVRELGMNGVIVRPNPYNGRNLHHPDYDDLYAAVADLDVPLVSHEGGQVWMPAFGDRFEEHIAQHALAHPFEQMGAVLSFTVGGVMERHPTLRVAFLEAGGSWLPYWLSRLDGHVEWLGRYETPTLTMQPSEYFKRQGWIGFEADEPGIRTLIDFIGADRLLWASDYPHTDAKKDPVGELFEHATAIADDELSQILTANPRQFYGI